MRRATALAFILSFVAFALLYLQFAVLYDSDSYYHLAVARHYAAHGLFAPIPWARFSLLASGADKELLFHVALMPFVALFEPSTGGRIALALLNAAIFAVVGNFCARVVGRSGFAIPLTLWLAAPPFFARAARLRPELAALLIILIAIPIAAKKRWLALGVLAMLFAYSYTAWHVFLVLCVLWWLLFRPAFRDMLPVVGGTLIALFVRPHPVANLQLWYVQNVAFFFEKARLDVGDEILPPNFLRILILTLGWILFLALTCREKPRREPLAIAAAVPAVVFALLFIGLARMATYVFPLATIALVVACGRRAPIAIAAGTLLGLFLSFDPNLVRMLAGGRISETDWKAFGQHVPPGAKIAATWGDAERYALYAPQGRYLNVLDPIFMARPHPREYAIQRAVFSGAHPDIATAVKRDLDSDFIAFDWTTVPRELIDRAKSDPRLRARYGGYNVLLEVVPSNDVVFTAAPNDRCTTFERVEVGPQRFAFAPYGAGSVAVDGRVVASTQGALAILSHGVRVDVPNGAHRVSLRVCPAGGINGFYFVPQR